jgi:hypothetical protein
MLSAHLVRMVEQHADKLSDELVGHLTHSERTTAFRRVSPDQLRQGIYKLYHRLGEWLAAPSDDVVETEFGALGRQWFQAGVPLEELIYGLTVIKQHLRERIRSSGSLYSSVELHNELQVGMAIGRFFDTVLYSVVKSFEEARRKAATGHGHTGDTGHYIHGPGQTQIDWLP